MLAWRLDGGGRVAGEEGYGARLDPLLSG